MIRRIGLPTVIDPRENDQHPPGASLGNSRQASEVYNNLVPRLAAANRDIAVGWRLKRFGLVAYGTGEQAAFAGVADTRAARPSYVPAPVGRQKQAHDGVAASGHQVACSIAPALERLAY